MSPLLVLLLASCEGGGPRLEAAAAQSLPEGGGFAGGTGQPAGGSGGTPLDANTPADANTIPAEPGSPQVPPVPGLDVAVYHRGTFTPGGNLWTHQVLEDVAAFVNDPGTRAAYHYLDTRAATDLGITYGNQDNTLTNDFLGDRASGPATGDLQLLETTVLDHHGQLTFTVPGTYTFTVHGVDDAAAIFIDGDGRAGSGQRVVEAFYHQGVQSGEVEIAAPQTRAFELLYTNFNFNSVDGGAGLDMSIAGPGPVTCATPPPPSPPLNLVYAGNGVLPAIAMGPPERISLPAMPPAVGTPIYFNDSVFPYLPNQAGTAQLTFWVNATAWRSEGPDLLHMASPDPAAPVLAGGAMGTYSGHGVWLMNAIRLPSGELLGLFHAEDHTFTNPGTGEWNSAGIALSSDDGASWSGAAQVVGIGKPDTAAYGGREVTSMVWDPAHARWLGVGHGIGYESQDPKAAAGTWKNWDGSGFTQAQPDPANTNTYAALPGLTEDMAECKISYNTHLNAYLLLYRPWGQDHLDLAVSTDLVHWQGADTIFTSPTGALTPDNDPVSHAQFIGTSDVEHGQDAYLVYGQKPATQPGRYRDLMIRRVRFNP